jgi:hypothetical protein
MEFIKRVAKKLALWRKVMVMASKVKDLLAGGNDQVDLFTSSDIHQSFDIGVMFKDRTRYHKSLVNRTGEAAQMIRDCISSKNTMS